MSAAVQTQQHHGSTGGSASSGGPSKYHCTNARANSKQQATGNSCNNDLDLSSRSRRPSAGKMTSPSPDGALKTTEEQEDVVEASVTAAGETIDSITGNSDNNREGSGEETVRMTVEIEMKQQSTNAGSAEEQRQAANNGDAQVGKKS